MRKRERREKPANELMLEEMLFGKKVSGKELAPTTSRNEAASSSSAKNSTATEAAWNDEDDNEIEIDLSSTDRLRKLIKVDTNDKISGNEFSTLLQDRFQTRELEWAKVGNEDSEISNTSELLREAGTMVEEVGSKSRKDTLSAGKIDMKRMVDANAAEPSAEEISTLHFHASGNLLLVGGKDKSLRFFSIDGEKNEKQLSVRFNDMAISNAKFVGLSSEVVVAGRKPYFYSYDTSVGAVTKIPGLMGKTLKSYEHMVVSAEGSKIAFAGTSGFVHICCGRRKTWISDVKMNCGVRSMAFVDEMTLATSGVDADVYLWDLRKTGRCLHRFSHEDGMCSSALAAGPGSPFLAVGSESGVVSLFQAQIGGSGGGGSAEGPPPAPAMMKSILNLTTKIDSLSFHPSSQFFAMASSEKVDQLRLVHAASGSVFTNWPTERTPLRKVSCLDFSPGGAYFAVGNNRGRVLLYRVNQFDNA